MYKIDLSRIKDEIVRDIYEACLSNNVIQKHTIDYTWISGSSTDVYPIMVWPYDVEVQVDTNNSVYFNKAIKRVLAVYPHLFKDGYFCKSDGSCPSYIRFQYADALLERIKQRTNNKK